MQDWIVDRQETNFVDLIKAPFFCEQFSLLQQ